MPVSRIDEAGLNVSQYGNRNLIINGAMQVAQRGTSAVAAADAYATVDRFGLFEGTDGAYTSEQSSVAPDGFANSLKLAVTTADGTLAAGQYAYCLQAIEAQNLQHLKYGTASAENVTLSFWVRSSKTGTYCVTLDKNDTTRYNFIKEYTINSANTWEYKTITVTPDSNIKASGGAIDNNNGIGFRVFWWLAAGSTYTGGADNAWTSTTANLTTSNQVNWMDNTSNDFYLTGVQLEVGDTATDFEHRSYGDELLKCQRYYELIGAADSTTYITQSTASVYGNSASSFGLLCKIEKRAYPTVTVGTLEFFTASGWSNSVSVTDGSRTNAFFSLTGYSDDRLVRGYGTVDAEL